MGNKMGEIRKTVGCTWQKCIGPHCGLVDLFGESFFFLCCAAVQFERTWTTRCIQTNESSKVDMAGWLDVTFLGKGWFGGNETFSDIG